jgi:hypothetical protein
LFEDKHVYALEGTSLWMGLRTSFMQEGNMDPQATLEISTISYKNFIFQTQEAIHDVLSYGN